MSTEPDVFTAPFRRLEKTNKLNPVPSGRYHPVAEEMHKLGFSVAELNLMAKTNPALALGLKP